MRFTCSKLLLGVRCPGESVRSVGSTLVPDDTVELLRDMLVKQALADALQQRGYTDLTPVQEAVTKPELEGADLLVSAQTGSGKTVGFALALAPTLLGDAEVFGQAEAPLALIIAPTRELALQVKRELAWVYEKANVVMASCVGGMDMRDERRTLARGAHIVVATPGRLRDHIQRGSIDLSGARAVVMDEADEMLDLGFRDDLEFILEHAPEERRTLMFSATVPRAIGELAKRYQKDAVRVTTLAERSQHADITYQAMSVGARDAENAVINVLRFYEAPSAIVFANTRVVVNRLTTRLSNRGFSVVSLSGELSQNERSHALQAMRDGRAKVCVATDVAARGIDLPNLELVVHAELPSNHETLLHRSGRTGRAGRKGVSSLIVTPKDRKKAERILKFARLNAEWGEAPSAEAVVAKDEERMLASDGWRDPIQENEAEMVATLTSSYDPDQIAAAYLRLYRERQSAPEELAAAGPDAPRQPREAFGPSTWFAVDGGRAAGAEPRRLLPMLCKAGDLTKNDIGAIRIQQDQSFVEVRQSSVAKFMNALGSSMTVEGGAKVSQLNEAPTLQPRPQRAKPSRSKYDPDAPRAPREDRAPREEPRAVVHDTKPTEWNDDPTPRQRKPKPEERRRAEEARGDRAGKPQGGKPGKTPVGKPNSKKNKARAAAAAADGKPAGRPGAKFRAGGPGFKKRGADKR